MLFDQILHEVSATFEQPLFNSNNKNADATIAITETIHNVILFAIKHEIKVKIDNIKNKSVDLFFKKTPVEKYIITNIIY